MPKKTPVRIIDQPYVGIAGSKVAGSGIRPGTGGGITIHNELSGRSANDTHPIEAITNLRLELDSMMEWRGVWSSAITYNPNDVVRDDGWTMIALTATQERPSPQPIGDPGYFYSGSGGTASATAAQLIQGMQYSNPTVSYQINGYRIYAIAGNRYNVYSVNENDEISPLISFTADSTGWVEFSLNPIIVYVGTTFSLIAITSEPDPTPTVWSANYDYDTPNNISIPLPGQISHSNQALSELRIHTLDNDGTDRGVALRAMSIGDVIEGVGQSWAIQAINDNGAWILFAVAPTTQGAPDGVAQFDFETVTPTPITHFQDTGYWAANANIRGLLGVDIPLESIVPDANQYGVDLLLQNVSVSEDWGVISEKDASATGGGGGGGDTHAPVTSPLQTIQVGGGTGQEIEVNQGYAFTWSQPHDFQQYITTPEIRADNNLLLNPNADIITDDRIRSSNYVADTAGSAWDPFFGNAEFNELQARATLEVGGDASIGGNANVSGHINTNQITSSGDLTIAPGGNLLLYPTADVLMDGIQRFKDFAGTGPGVFIDWSGTLGSRFPTLDVETLTAQMFSVKNAEVAVGQLIVGRSASQLTRPITLDCDAIDFFEFMDAQPFIFMDGQPFDLISTPAPKTIYVKNIPGAGDMKAFRDGDDIAFYYFCEGGASRWTAAIGESKHGYAEREGEPGGGNVVLENFDSVTPPALPANWTQTDTGNSTGLPQNQNNWITTAALGSKALRTDPTVGDDSNYHIHWVGTDYLSRANYEYTGRSMSYSLTAGRGMTILSWYPGLDQYVRVRRHNNYTYHVAVHGYNPPSGGITESGFKDKNDGTFTLWRMRIEDDGSNRTTLKARFWYEGETEPTIWSINCWWDGTDRPKTGTFGLWGYNNANNPVYYDDLRIEDVAQGTIDPSVTISMNNSNDVGAIVAFVTSSASISSPPAGFAPEKTSGTVNGLLTEAYINQSPTSGAQSYTWTDAAGDGFAVTMVSIENENGTGLINNFVYQNGESWTDSTVPSEQNIFEIVLAAVHGQNTVVSTTNAAPLASYSESAQYRHKLSILKAGNEKPQSIGYVLEAAAEGSTSRFWINSQADTGASQYGIAYGKVEYIDPGDLEADEQAWSLRLTKAPCSGCIVSPGAGIFDLGVSGDSFWIANAIDPLSGGSYDQIVRRGDNPWDWEVKLRSGYLGGLPTLGELGFYYAEGNSIVELSDRLASFTNVYMEWNDAAGNRTGYVHENLGFAAYEDPYASIEEGPRGYALLSQWENAIIGGAYGWHDKNTDTAIVRLEADYTYGIANTRAEVEASAAVGNVAEASVFAYRGPYWDRPAQAGMLATVDAADNATIEIYGQITMTNLPTSNPGGNNILWNDNGTVKIT